MAAFTVSAPSENATLETSMDGGLTLRVSGSATYQAKNGNVPEIFYWQNVSILLDTQSLGATTTYAGTTDGPWSFDSTYSFNALSSLGAHKIEITVSKTVGSDTNLTTVTRDVTIVRAPDTAAPSIAITAPAPGSSVGRTPEVPEPVIAFNAETSDSYSGLASAHYFLDGSPLPNLTTTFPPGTATATLKKSVTIPYSKLTKRVLRIEVSDGAGNTSGAEQSLDDLDTWVPSVTFVDPVSTLPYTGSTEGNVSVPVRFRVRDAQSGLASVEWRLDNAAFQALDITTPGTTDAIEWSFSVEVSGVEGPHSIGVHAVDSATGIPANKTTKVATFTIGAVVSDTVQDLLSPETYLAHLLNFCTANVRTSASEQSPQVSPAELTVHFIQPFLDLADGNIEGAEQLACDLLFPVRLLRTTIPGSVPDAAAAAAVSGHHRRSYETLLRGLGTSFGEVRNLRFLSAVERQNLADRLGLWNGTPGAGDRLDLLTAPAGVAPGSSAFEQWLAERFGLPRSDHLDLQGGSPPTPTVLATRQALQLDAWNREDQSNARPDADPDLMADEDLASASNPWRKLLKARVTELESKYQTLFAVPAAGDAIASVFSAEEQATLRTLQASAADGLDISAGLADLQIDMPMFVQLLGYMDIAGKGLDFSIYEREDLANVLVQRWKRHERYGPWVAEERAMPPPLLWPTPATKAAWIPGKVQQSFPAWRASAALRSALEARLNGRIRLGSALAVQQGQAISDAQRAALPGLRDGLLGLAANPDPDRLMNDLTQRWLADFAATGASSFSAVDQAIASMQTLMNGVRNKWFDASHPAFGWTISSSLLTFEEQWARLADFDNWRTAVNNYLYPENVLYPELKDDSPALQKFIAELSNIRPLTTSSLKTPPSTYTIALNAVPSGDDRDYFVPVAIGLALQRAGLYVAALGYYRLVYDPTLEAGNRKRAAILANEDDNEAPVADFSTSNWIGRLADPHTLVTQRAKGQGRCNPYTRFTLFQILKCLLAQADDAFANGSRDGRVRALAIYLEAEDILQFTELQDRVPLDPKQVFLPSPVLASMRDHVGSALRKLRVGLSYLGTPLPPDSTRDPAAGMMSSLTRPTVYRYKTLIERSKLLASQAQQFEDKYLGAIERGDAETEKYLSSGFVAASSEQTVNLKTLQATEANDSVTAAQGQLAKSQMQADRYAQLIAAGPTGNERTQVDMIWDAKTARDVISGLDAALTASQAAQSAMSATPWAWFGAAATSNFAIAKGVAQGFLNDNEARAQVSGILAAQERRAQEWQFQQDVANQDVAIAGQQIGLAQDRLAIANQETAIAEGQRDQARQMLAFLGSKFTSARFYQWFIGELAQIYATFLRLATAAASNAEKQLAFERQEQALGLIKADYWLVALNAAASTTSRPGGGGAIDPRGITGSSRLLQDIYTLDEQAFGSERRLLNLTQSFSLAGMMPSEFQEFRRSGNLTFTTPMQWFDEGFPGHYIRLIKRVRISVAALISPLQGIRATLSNSGFSRVVTGDPGFPLTTLHQDPQLIALSSAASGSGVFDLDTQADILYPFEGTGVDTTWYFELSPAGNFFNFASLFDVVISIDYTAKFSIELRDRVIKALPRSYAGDRAFSIKRELPDAWYEMVNSVADSVDFAISISDSAFPPSLTSLRVSEVSVLARTTKGLPADFQATLVISLSNGGAVRKSGAAMAIEGLVSSRQASARSWHAQEIAGQVVDVIDNLPAVTGQEVLWKFELANEEGATSFLKQLRAGEIDDVLVTMTLNGLRPSWS